MKKKPPEPENLERWMVSYADFMTLLFALFVVLYAFAMAKQSEAKAMVESISQAFTESKAISSPGGALLIPGSMSTQLSEDSEEAMEEQTKSSGGDSGKQVITDGGMMMSFQVESTTVSASEPSESSGSNEHKEGQNTSDSASSSGELVISDSTVSKNEVPKSTKPDGGSDSGDGGFQAGGSADKFENGGLSDVDADSEGQGKVGTHFDAVRKSVSEAITDTGMEKYIQIEEDPHWLSININSGLLFAEGSASVLNPSKPVLARIAIALSNINNYVRVRGYTDDTFIPNGIFKNSWDLSAQRAISVLAELERNGLDPERMAIEAFGEFSNTYSNRTSAGRALNRKVVIAISRYAIEKRQEKYIDAEIRFGDVGRRSDESIGQAGSRDIDVVRGEGNSIELNFNQK
ncbi:MAG: OmpA family protein [Succinivibrio sp.]|nr:OmpA family protein [Succinivibrio sp.]